MNTAIAKLLKEHYVDGVFHTHVSLIKPTGKFQLNRESMEKLWDIYCDLAENDNEILGIGEKPTYYLPVLCDIDIKIEDNNNEYSEEEHIYNEKNVNDIIQIYQSILRNIVEDCTDDNLLCVVLEKPIYTITKNDIVYYKNGFHLHFPNCFLRKTDQEIHLIPRVQDCAKEMKVFENLGFEDSGSLIDKACCKVHWLMYGSVKNENSKPYKITRIVNSECKNISFEEAFKYYQLFDIKENLIDMKGNYKKYIARILSILPYGRKCQELKQGLSLPEKEKINKEELNVKKQNKNFKTSVTKNLKISERLLPMLSHHRADDYNEWMTVGWVLYSIGEGCLEALDQWLEFSSRSDKYNEEKCIYEWERMVKKDFTLGTLRFYAEKDNEKLYQEFKNEQSQENIRSSLEGSHHDIAKLLYTEFCNRFVCASITNKTWYEFKEHHWVEIEQGVYLRKLISEDIVEKYIDEGCKLFQKVATHDKGEENMYQTKIKQVQKLISNLKNSSYKNNIMNEACEVFYNEHFKNKLDMNPYLIGFKNGVYDLKLNEFRTGRPEDFISKHMPINYIVFNNNDDRVKNVHSFLEKIFPDTSVKKYFMNQASDVFVGGNYQKVACFWTGDGDNGKSVTQTIFEKMLGEYAIKFSTTLVTGKKGQLGSASPELARAGGGGRWAVLEEPDGDEQINIGLLKSLTGNDSYWARDLFEKGKSTREIQPLFKLIFICLSGNTNVCLSNGTSVSIEKLINNKQKLLSWDSKTHGLLNTRQHVFLNKGKQECLTIKLLDGREITCTPNHKYNTFLKMGVTHPNVDDLFDDYNYILDCENYKFNMSEQDDKIKAMAYVRLLGYMLTDVSRNKSLYIGHRIDCETILLDIELLTNKRPTITPMTHTFKIELPIELTKSFNSLSILQSGGRVNNPMILPDFLFKEECPLFIKREFIASMFGGDGILPSFVKNTFGNVQLVASKKEKYLDSLVKMYEKLSDLILKLFNIESNVTIQQYEKRILNKKYEDTLKNKDALNNDKEKSYHVFLNINKNESIINFCEQIGFRYCCHKSHRITAVLSCFKYKKAIIEQNIRIINRTKELFTKYNKNFPKPLIVKMEKKTNTIIKIYKSTQVAQHDTLINHSIILEACKRNGTSGGYSLKFQHQKKEIQDQNGYSTIMEAHKKAVEEITEKEGVINRKYLVTYTQTRRYIADNLEYKMPSINLKEYLLTTNLFQFCNQNKGNKKHHYSVNILRTTLPCYSIPVIFVKNSGIHNVYDINVDKPYSNFLANGIVTHNCNQLPTFRGCTTDPAAWNRVKVIPFESTFVKPGDTSKEPAPESYEEQLLKKRFPMDMEFYKKIPDLLEPFAWVLLEHRKHIRDRVEPEKVTIATKMYKRQNDIYRQFIDESIIESNTTISLIELYNNFKEWYRQGFPNHTIPVKNDIKEYFTKLWDEPGPGIKWYGYRIRTLEDDINEGNALVLEDEDFENYEGNEDK